MAMVSSFKMFSNATRFARCVDLLARIGKEIENCSFGVYGFHSKKRFMAEIRSSAIVLAAFIFTENTHPEFQAVTLDFHIKDDVDCMNQLRDHLLKLGPTTLLTMNVYPNPQDGKESMETISRTNWYGEQVNTITWKHMVDKCVDPQHIPDYVFGQILKVTVETAVFKQYLLKACDRTTCESYNKDAKLTIKVDDFQFVVCYGNKEEILGLSEWRISGEAEAREMKKCSFTLFSIWTLTEWAM